MAGSDPMTPPAPSAPDRPPVYEHPWAIRFTHWTNAVALSVLALSGLQIFSAFPSFGPKSPEHDVFDPSHLVTLGGWLGGALQWHLTFMWIFMGSACSTSSSRCSRGISGPCS